MQGYEVSQEADMSDEILGVERLLDLGVFRPSALLFFWQETSILCVTSGPVWD